MSNPIKYDRQSIVEGNLAKTRAEESSTVGSMMQGAEDIQAPGNLAGQNQQRFAGQRGVFALELMQNPQASMNVNTWMNEFGQSVPGAQFNEEKTRQAMANAELEQTNAMLGK